MTNVRLALVQSHGDSNPDRCVDQAVDAIERAAQQNAQIVCLQELFTGCYPCQSEDHRNFDHAESIDSPRMERIAEAAKASDAVVVAPIFERRTAGLYHNTAVVYDADGSMAGFYRKMHIPDDPLYYEKFYFTPGDEFCVISTKYAKLGVGICWDQWFPEAARLFTLSGAEIILYPTAIGWIEGEKDEFGKTQHEAWQTMMRSHAIANGLFVGAPNRVGKEGEIEFWGASFVAGPNGQILAQSNHEGDDILVADCNLNLIEVTRTHWPFLRDRRIDAYHNLTKRWVDPS